jgi:adenosylcobyric acid synthase
MSARCVMVLGTTSGAGKSLLATALCRWYARQGLKVAPFKAQNMSNNARVVQGGEIGSAQYFQALAARSVPEVRMNPLLLKPETDTHSQVILLGQVSRELSEMPWRSRGCAVWPAVTAALDELRAENDVVVIEGAGSPAEINLADSDIVNMRVAEYADARCLLVTDIDRGGAFAHLYGTWALLDDAQRRRIDCFVLNKFRGDASLLAPGPDMLRDLTGIGTAATLPMWREHGLPQEDGMFSASAVFPPSPLGEGRGGGQPPARRHIAVVAYPRISNLDEFQPLHNIPGVHLTWARSADDVAQADWIILPGSKNTSADLAWLRARGLARAIAQHARSSRAVLGICGGLQMLGEALIDHDDIDGNAPGLGLLPLVTVFEPDKTVRRTQTRFGALNGQWQALSGVSVSGYEIHHGRTSQHTGMAAARMVMPDALAWQNEQGNVLGVYVHGLFEQPAVLRALFGAGVPTLDRVFDGLADFVEQHFLAGVLCELATPRLASP